MTDALTELAFVAPELADEDYTTIAAEFEDDEIEAIQSAAEQLAEQQDD